MSNSSHSVQQLLQEEDETDELLSKNHQNTTCLAIAHLIAWICLIVDLFLLPIMTWSVVIISGALFTTKPCGCYGIGGNVGVCDCFLTQWRASESFNWANQNFQCFGDHPKSEWHPQFCPSSDRGWIVVICIFSAIFFTQYMLCVFAWGIWIFHCLLCILLRILWVIWCILWSFLHLLWWCINMQVKKNACQFFKELWRNREWMEEFNIEANKKVFKHIIWELFAPQPGSHLPGEGGPSLIMTIFVTRLFNLIPTVLIFIFIIIVPLNKEELNKFNCNQYNEQTEDGSYDLIIFEYWNFWLKSELFKFISIVQVILVVIMFIWRRTVLCLLQMNSPDIESDKNQRFYLRMIGKKYNEE